MDNEAQQGDSMSEKTIEERLAALEARLNRLEQASDTIAHLMSTLGGKFQSVKSGILTAELANFFAEVGRTLSSVGKNRGR